MISDQLPVNARHYADIYLQTEQENHANKFEYIYSFKY